MLKCRVQWELNAPYTQEKNRKTERLNYIFISSVYSIMAIIKLSKLFLGQILKTAAYLKNQRLNQKKVTIYERANEKKPSLKYWRVVGSCARVHVHEKPRKKLNNTVWQEIFV